MAAKFDVCAAYLLYLSALLGIVEGVPPIPRVLWLERAVRHR
jgi:hypothetical protein